MTTGPGAAASLRTNDARNVACPVCGVKRVAKCLKPDGLYLKGSHRARAAALRAERAR